MYNVYDATFVEISWTVLLLLGVIATGMWVLEMRGHDKTKKYVKFLHAELEKPIEVWCALHGGYKDFAALVCVSQHGILSAPGDSKRVLKRINAAEGKSLLGAPEWDLAVFRMTSAFGRDETPYVELLGELYRFNKERPVPNA